MSGIFIVSEMDAITIKKKQQIIEIVNTSHGFLEKVTSSWATKFHNIDPISILQENSTCTKNFFKTIKIFF